LRLPAGMRPRSTAPPILQFPIVKIYVRLHPLFWENKGICFIFFFIKKGDAMKFKIFCAAILVAALALPSICFSEKPDPGVWEYYATDSKGRTCYYNKTNMNKSSDIITVWIYNTVTDADRQEAIDRAKKLENQKMEMLHKTYDHENTLFDIDCKNRYFKIKESIEYDVQGTVIDNFQYGNIIPWLAIDPKDIRLEKLFNTVCVVQEKTDQKK
jgi:hypothetical protein